MITLKDDRLSFTFPEIDQTVRHLAELEIKSTLPCLLTEDRTKALQRLRSNRRFEEAKPADRAEVERQLLQATPAEIEQAVNRITSRVVNLAGEISLAALDIHFQRTLRIPDDGKIYPLPAGFGRFPLRDVDQFRAALDAESLQRGGVLMPMYQSEALWIYFRAGYPFAVKVAAGKINAVTGEAWFEGLQADPQNYVVLPEQPWLDGFAVRRGIIRQFVAIPLGTGYSVEEQLTGTAEVGGLQLQVYPLKAEVYFRSKVLPRMAKSYEDLVWELVTLPASEEIRLCSTRVFEAMPCAMSTASMGLGAGGTMRQEIFKDRRAFEDWDQSTSSRCFVHLCNSLVWRQITGATPPHPPFTAREYAASRIPWFDYYRDDLDTVPGSKILDKIRSVFDLGQSKGDQPLPDNSSLEPNVTIQYGNARRPNEVREWAGKG
jgi:hypothetical protein